jgi:hypothetical protein
VPVFEIEPVPKFTTPKSETSPAPLTDNTRFSPVTEAPLANVNRPLADKTVAAPESVTGPVNVASPNPRIAPPPATPDPVTVNGSAANVTPSPISNAAFANTVVPAVTAPSAETDITRKVPSATVTAPVNAFTPPSNNVPASHFDTAADPLIAPFHDATRPDETRKFTP